MTPEDADRIVEAHKKRDTAKILEIIGKDTANRIANLNNSKSKGKFIDSTNEPREAALKALGILQPEYLQNLTTKQKREREERIAEENNRVQAIESRLNKEKAETLEIVNSFFDCSKEDCEAFIADGHTLQESSVKHIIDDSTGYLV